MTEELEEYILAHIDEEGEMLRRLDRETHLFHHKKATTCVRACVPDTFRASC